MNTSQWIQQTSQNILRSGERGFQWIGRAITRIFTPTDDRYPETGVQPFEGDSYDEKKAKR